MFGNEYSEDHRPITYLRGYPIHAATLFVIVHVVAFVLGAMLEGFGQQGILAQAVFTSHAIYSRLALWQFASYALVHPAGQGIWFAIEMWLLFQFGREVEQFLGRRAFLRLYFCLLLIGPLVLTAVGWFMPAMLFGSATLHFGIFIAFALLYPSAAIFFGIAARWVAIILLAIYTLQGFANNQWESLIVLWTTTPLVFLFVQHARGRISLPSLNLFERKPKFTVLPPPAARRRDVEESDDLESIDPLLDKIARSGMASLSAKERARLEKAREALIRKDRQ